MSESIRIGVSACALGEQVRHDGTHAQNHYLTETFRKYVEFIPLCPELACGMRIPRERVRQIDCAGDIRLIGEFSGEDWTDRMNQWADRILPGLEEDELSGFVFKSHSPSCALVQGKIHSTTGKPTRRGTGFFARRMIKHFPLLPVEASTRLHNPYTRENFLRRVFVYKRWQNLIREEKKIGRLLDFHARHKMLIRAHDLKGYREMGKLLGESSVSNTDKIFDLYAQQLFQSLKLKATPTKNADVLMHVLGFFKKQLGHADKAELLEMIQDYKNGELPLLVPVTVLNHYARKYDIPYLMQQYYLNPDKTELKLLNHV
ncbi:DUF523 and DUF1722 domain-containing protein [uncultured Pseudodesulfovibrio sp.]|uniref:YbgA family protein n=1 Tax=uncultured Pseudodesulfovibrio sp. TaxID=2035858 RepID=UPI0029C803F5|nr:DUF523 and DUF1722 domain-containing protein [uncultured Pseudodesulfovibrio sp.]